MRPESDIKFLKAKNLSGLEGASHFFSTGLAGSDIHSHESAEAVIAGSGLKDEPVPPEIVFAKQVHGTDVLRIDGAKERSMTERINADILITSTKGLLVSVRTADCCPILIASLEMHTVCAVHAGWKGTLDGITGKALDEMSEGRKADPRSIYMAIGPSIRGCCYSVPRERFDLFKSLADSSDGLIEVKDGVCRIDLATVNAKAATKWGIPAENIEIIDRCTYCSNLGLYSYRRDRGVLGGQVSGIMLTKD